MGGIRYYCERAEPKFGPVTNVSVSVGRNLLKACGMRLIGAIRKDDSPSPTTVELRLTVSRTRRASVRAVVVGGSDGVAALHSIKEMTHGCVQDSVEVPGGS
jgi:hypothetical protein